MKKIAMAIAAALMMSTSAMAQNEEKKGEPRQFNKTEMIQQRTDATVKRYGLNEEQAAKLLELNTKYADKMGPMRGGPRGQQGGRGFGGRQGMGQGQGQGPRMHRQAPDSLRNNAPRMNREEMQKSMEEYDTQLKAIFTPEQYETYQADQKKMREARGNRGGFGDRQRPTQRQ
jgi:hypothetical protein